DPRREGIARRAGDGERSARVGGAGSRGAGGEGRNAHRSRLPHRSRLRENRAEARGGRRANRARARGESGRVTVRISRFFRKTLPVLPVRAIVPAPAATFRSKIPNFPVCLPPPRIGRSTPPTGGARNGLFGSTPNAAEATRARYHDRQTRECPERPGWRIAADSTAAVCGDGDSAAHPSARA